MRKAHALVLAILLAAATAWAQEPPAAPDSQDQQQAQAIATVVRTLQAGRAQEALAEADKVIAHYEGRYRGGKTFVFSSRSQVETLFYLLQVSTNQASAPGDAGVYARHWGDAYFLKGYALLELRRPAEALAALQAAVALAPRNSQYLTELGQVQVALGELDGAMESFARAEAAAREFSPPDAKTAELARALRSQGFVLVERRQFDEAEKRYRQCLELDPADRNALRELDYIRKARQGAVPR